MMLTPSNLVFNAASQVRRTLKAPDVLANGVTPATFAQVLSVADAVPTVFCNGLGYTASGALAAGAGAVASRQQGIPFTADGRVSLETAAVTGYSNGLPFTASGAIAAAALE
jgi:predicted methyltransferase